MRQQHRHPHNNSTKDNNSSTEFHFKIYEELSKKNSKDVQSLSSIDSTITSSTSSLSETEAEFVKLKLSQIGGHHWHSILDELTTQVQMRRKLLPLPTAVNGVTYVGGNISLEANRICVACMNGEMNASRFFLFNFISGAKRTDK